MSYRHSAAGFECNAEEGVEGHSVGFSDIVAKADGAGVDFGEECDLGEVAVLSTMGGIGQEMVSEIETRAPVEGSGADEGGLIGTVGEHFGVVSQDTDTHEGCELKLVSVDDGKAVVKLEVHDRQVVSLEEIIGGCLVVDILQTFGCAHVHAYSNDLPSLSPVGFYVESATVAEIGTQVASDDLHAASDTDSEALGSDEIFRGGYLIVVSCMALGHLGGGGIHQFADEYLPLFNNCDIGSVVCCLAELVHIADNEFHVIIYIG